MNIFVCVLSQDYWNTQASHLHIPVLPFLNLVPVRGTRVIVILNDKISLVL